MKIEKNVPAPTSRGKYQFKDMEVGDSAFFEGGRVTGKEVSAARRYGDYHGKKFVARSVNDGVRIWRIK